MKVRSRFYRSLSGPIQIVPLDSLDRSLTSTKNKTGEQKFQQEEQEGRSFYRDISADSCTTHNPSLWIPHVSNQTNDYCDQHYFPCNFPLQQYFSVCVVCSKTSYGDIPLQKQRHKKLDPPTERGSTRRRQSMRMMGEPIH